MFDIVIFGCGDIGRRVASLWQARGHRVTGVVRTAASVTRLQELGVHAAIADLDDRAAPASIPLGNALVYYLVPPPPRGLRDTRLRSLLATVIAPPYPRRIVYLSTTGVYGDCHGDWVAESRPCNPETDRARRRVDAERALREWSRRTGTAVITLRVPGIYGPGRLPIERVRQAQPVLPESEAPFTNRIHAEDLATICVAAAERGQPDAIYNVSDGQPSTMTAYLNAIADRFGVPRPPVVNRRQAERRMSPAMLSYLSESRRIDNRRMLDELNVTLRYPTFEAGLDACATSETE